ncbi:uncharacterized protein BDR25DRAFT_243221 [Lindgomyces ingoldianus]|uniref:Uncharacterized protein n=1 Tax=Lindgomyces ingoldianus TaxID=673940 RepID=A0ACB6QC35_9PLEO|nr:uncharacterized protein BDR25DRAFT_243221 [Lindgomyces ingoldianus]KAF2464168.1 hypothetical protein BDR25DRAFT_243221 [Lindgomyces ingoldianus]
MNPIELDGLTHSTPRNGNGSPSSGFVGYRTSAAQNHHEPIEGWPRLASLMAQNQDFAAFPRFKELNVKSLLYYQCQLARFKKKLLDLEWEDAPREENFPMFADELVISDSEQFKTVKEMRVVLKEYNEALLLFSKICSLPDPEPFNMRTLRKWLKHRDCGNWTVRSTAGLGLENTWGNIYANEPTPNLLRWSARVLLGLVWKLEPKDKPACKGLAWTAPQIKTDGLTQWAVAEFMPWWRALHKKTQGGQHLTKGLVYWSERPALRATGILSTVLACLLPTVSVWVLAKVDGLNNLLWCVTGFTFLFVLGLIFLTQGESTRTEIFAATAA